MRLLASTLIVTTLIFIFFKLIGVGEISDWSWWKVTAPTWVSVAFIFVYGVVAIVFNDVRDKFKKK